MCNRKAPTFDVIVHIFVYFDEFYRISYNTPTETILLTSNCSFLCASVRVVRGKKPEYSLLCAEAADKLSDGQQLRVLRLCAGLTIREASEMVEICRHTLMNYESGKTKVKAHIKKKLVRLYQSLIDRQRCLSDLFFQIHFTDFQPRNKIYP